MNPEIASLITDLDLLLYSYEKAAFYKDYEFEFTYSLGALTSLESVERPSVGNWAFSSSAGTFRKFHGNVVRPYESPDFVYIRRTSSDRQDLPQRLGETFNSLRYRPSNCFAGLFDRVPRQLALFEDGTA